MFSTNVELEINRYKWWKDWYIKKSLRCSVQSMPLEELWLKINLWLLLQSNQVKRTPQEYINEFIIQKLNPLLVVDFRLISAFLYV